MIRNEATIGGIVVAGQPTPEELRSGRFSHVINVRPDDEPGNITAAALEGSGVGYTHIPYTAATLTAEHVHRIRDVLAAEPGPTILH